MDEFAAIADVADIRTTPPTDSNAATPSAITLSRDQNCVVLRLSICGLRRFNLLFPMFT